MDDEWALVVSFMLRQWWLGRPRATALHDIVNALLYITSTGCQWRQLPNNLPPYATVQGYLYRCAEKPTRAPARSTTSR